MLSRISSRTLVVVLFFTPVVSAVSQDKLQPIERVEIRAGRVIHVNGKIFFPRMAWLQDPENFAAVRACGMNTVAGYWQGSGGTKDVKEYLDRVEAAGLYGVMPFDERLKGHPALLGYIQDDEPDLPRRVSDAEVKPSKTLHINPKTPLWKLVDGDVFSWSVLDPLQGASVTIRPKASATAKRVALWLTVSPGMAVAREVAFEADGKELLRVTVAKKKGRQAFDLPKPATFRELTLRVVSTFPGDNAWGSLGEIEAFDADGKNVLLAPPRNVPRALPAEVMAKYREMKAHDPDRPVFLTLTGYFHPIFKKWGEEPRKRYPRYVEASDIVGYDVYPHLRMEQARVDPPRPRGDRPSGCHGGLAARLCLDRDEQGGPVDRSSGTSTGRDASPHPRRSLDGDLPGSHSHWLFHARVEARVLAVRSARSQPQSAGGG